MFVDHNNSERWKKWFSRILKIDMDNIYKKEINTFPRVGFKHESHLNFFAHLVFIGY